jgi:hypothetical protein
VEVGGHVHREGKVPQSAHLAAVVRRREALGERREAEAGGSVFGSGRIGMLQGCSCACTVSRSCQLTETHTATRTQRCCNPAAWLPGGLVDVGPTYLSVGHDGDKRQYERPEPVVRCCSAAPTCALGRVHPLHAIGKTYRGASEHGEWSAPRVSHDLVRCRVQNGR